MKKKNILISGASSDIGYQIILDLAKSSANIFALYNKNIKKINKLSKDLKALKIKNVKFYKLDFLNLKKTEKFSEFFFKKNNIDVLVNNAALSQRKKYLTLTNQDWINMLKCNLVTPFIFSKFAILNKKNDSLKIINISSIAAETGGIEQPHYAASKAGLSNLTKSISKQFAKKKIFSYTISPGVINTKSISKNKKKKNSKVIKSIPSGRLGSPKEISELIKYLINSNSEYSTGSKFNIDGGMI